MEILSEKNRIENPTRQAVNGKLQRVIMWSQIGDILEETERFPVSYYLREQINEIKCLDSIPEPSRRQIFVDEMNA